MREQCLAAIRPLLCAAVGLTAFPVMAMLGVFGLSLAYGLGDVTTWLLVLQLLCTAGLLAMTVLRLFHRKIPAWLWAVLPVGIAGATAALVVMNLDAPKAEVIIGLVLIPALGAAAVLALNGLWTLLRRGAEETPPEPIPRVLQSWPLRLVKTVLALLCAGGACVAAYWTITLYALFGSPNGLPSDMALTLLEEGAALFGYGVMGLSILRLVRIWYRPWALIGCSMLYGLLLTAASCMGGALMSRWGLELALVQLIYVLALLALNALWHLLEWKKETEESTNEQKA